MNDSVISTNDDVLTKSTSIGYEKSLFIDKLARLVAGSVVSVTLVFLFNAYLTYWLKWPSMIEYLSQLQWFGLEPPRVALSEESMTQGWWQALSYIAGVMFVAGYIALTPLRSLRQDSEILSAFSRYVIRASFWAVLLVGFADFSISLMRVEEVLHYFVSDETIASLGRSVERGVNVHYPIIVLSMVIALFTRTLGFTWLALMVVFAELQIVILGFVFSYEQAFMGDLVRFWYAALFLFASAHTLVADGHVRVDVLYAGLSKKTKAYLNSLGILLLGIPLCWIILTMGMWGKGSSIISPLLSFEISQSGYGLYVKYMMVGYLVIFSVSMMVQFSAYLLKNIADIRNEPEIDNPAIEAKL